MSQALWFEIATITCPQCGHKTDEDVTAMASPITYDCMNCKTRLRVPAGKCCILCAFSDAPCPKVQRLSGQGCGG